MIYVFVLVLGLLAGALTGIVGTGSSIILLPLLVIQFGPKQAVPIMAVSAVMSNIGKVLAWRREIDWKAFVAFSITGVPAAALGARTLLILPSHLIAGALGVFFLAMIPGRRLLTLHFKLSLWQLSVAGGLVGFLTGVLMSTGPLSVSAFLAYRLLKGPFLSTEAATNLLLMVTKVATFRQLGALPWPSLLKGITVGVSLLVGTFAGKEIVQRMSIGTFQYVLDTLLICSGLGMLWVAVA